MAFCTSDPDGRLGAMTGQTLDDALFADVLSAETRTAAVTWPGCKPLEVSGVSGRSRLRAARGHRPSRNAQLHDEVVDAVLHFGRDQAGRPVCCLRDATAQRQAGALAEGAALVVRQGFLCNRMYARA